MQRSVQGMKSSPFSSIRRLRSERSDFFQIVNASLCFSLLLLGIFYSERFFDWKQLTIAPLRLTSFPQVLSAPFMHSSWAQAFINSLTMFIVSSLTGMVYPRIILPALPIIWLGSGLSCWFLGKLDIRYFSFSGISHGLAVCFFLLGMLRRDYIPVVVGLSALLLCSGMMLALIFLSPDTHWQSHLGGSIAGTVCALMFRLFDHQHSWQLLSHQAKSDKHSQ